MDGLRLISLNTGFCEVTNLWVFSDRSNSEPVHFQLLVSEPKRPGFFHVLVCQWIVQSREKIGKCICPSSHSAWRFWVFRRMGVQLLSSYSTVSSAQNLSRIPAVSQILLHHLRPILRSRPPRLLYCFLRGHAQHLQQTDFCRIRCSVGHDFRVSESRLQNLRNRSVWQICEFLEVVFAYFNAIIPENSWLHHLLCWPGKGHPRQWTQLAEAVLRARSLWNGWLISSFLEPSHWKTAEKRQKTRTVLQVCLPKQLSALRYHVSNSIDVQSSNGSPQRNTLLSNALILNVLCCPIEFRCM